MISNKRSSTGRKREGKDINAYHKMGDHQCKRARKHSQSDHRVMAKRKLH